MSAELHLDLQTAIAAAWERRAALSPATKGADREAVEAALELLDSGKARVAAPGYDQASPEPLASLNCKI